MTYFSLCKYPVSSTGVCPVGFNEIDNVCYLLGTERKSFDHARRACRDLGAHVVEPRTSNINNVVQLFVERANYHWSIPVHIGLTRNNRGTYAWVSDPPSDQSPLPYTDWASNSTRRFGCVVMWSDNMGWTDVPCRFNAYYVCQRRKCKSWFIILFCLSVRLFRSES